MNRAVIREVETELFRACSKFGPIQSVHEGYAIIKEEVDEFWDEAKSKNRTPERLRAELVQIAAMAIRTAGDLT